MAVCAGYRRWSARTLLVSSLFALLLSSINIPPIAVAARAVPAAEGSSMDPPSNAAQLGKRTLLASGLPVAVSSLPLTKIDRPDPTSAHVQVPRGSNGTTAMLALTPVPLAGGFYNLPSFTASVGVGTPAQTQTVIVDTGSPTNWVTCSTCSGSCAPLKYNPTASSTSQTNLPCSSCTPPSYECDVGIDCSSGCNLFDNRNLCEFDIHYGDGSATSGPYYADTVLLGGFQTAASFSFGCANSEAGNLLTLPINATGLFGLGPSALSTWAQLNRDSAVPPLFSMCLSPNQFASSTLFLGGVPNIDNLAVAFTPQLDFSSFSFWEIGIPTGCLVNGVPIDSAAIVPDEFSNWIVDSGTTLTLLPATMLNAIAATLRTVTGLPVFFSPPRDANGNRIDQGLLIALSDNLGFDLTGAQYTSYLPPISLQLPGGVTLTAQSIDYVRSYFVSDAYSSDGSTQLIARVGLTASASGSTLIGDTFFNNHLIVFDGTNLPSNPGRVGFAPVNCNTLTALDAPVSVTLPPLPSATPASTTPAPTTPAPTTPAPTTPAPTTPAPTSGSADPGPDGTCYSSTATPNQCFTADGSKSICCAGQCPNPPAVGTPSCTPTTPAPTTPGSTTPAPTPTTPTVFPVGGVCNASSSLPNQCFSSDGSLYTCCPAGVGCPSPPMITPACATVDVPLPTTTPTNVPTATPGPSGPPPTTCDPQSALPNQCFNANGSAFICCSGPCPGLPGSTPSCS